MKDFSDIFYTKTKTPLEFKFDSLVSRPMFSMIPIELDSYLYSIATDITLNSKPKKKYELMDSELSKYGFELLARGTNRSTYRYFYDDSIVLKVGYDRFGVQDARREQYNQNHLRPFVCKCFEVSPSGALGLFERVTPLRYKEEFKSIAEDVFELLTKFVLGKYILADIGVNYYMNWGLRSGFGPVLLDYPFMYELDGNKLHCVNQIQTPKGVMQCNGLIDYDDGFNHLICERCGKTYLAQDLAKYNTEGKLEIIRGSLGGDCMPSIWVNGEYQGTWGGSDPLKEKDSIEKMTPLKRFLIEQEKFAKEANAKAQSEQIQRQLNLQTNSQPEVQQPVQNNEELVLDPNMLENVVKQMVLKTLITFNPDMLYQKSVQQPTNPQPVAQQPINPQPVQHPVQQPVQSQQVEQVQPLVQDPRIGADRYAKLQNQALNQSQAQAKENIEAMKFRKSRGSIHDRINFMFYKLEREFGDLYCRARIKDDNFLYWFLYGGVMMIQASEGVTFSADLNEYVVNLRETYITKIQENIERKKQRQQNPQQNRKPQQNQKPVSEPKKPESQQIKDTAPYIPPAKYTTPNTNYKPDGYSSDVGTGSVFTAKPTSNSPYDPNNIIGNPFDDPTLNIHDEIEVLSNEVEESYQIDQSEMETDLEEHFNQLNPEDDDEGYSDTTNEALENIQNSSVPEQVDNPETIDDNKSKF